MRVTRTVPLLASLPLASLWVAGCAGGPDGRTLSSLRDVEPDMSEVRVEDSLEQAIHGYRRFLEEVPESTLTPEAMRRLADLKLEKEYGLLGDGAPMEVPASAAPPEPRADRSQRPRPAGIADHSESQQDFERRASVPEQILERERGFAAELPGAGRQPAGPLEAIALYDEILAEYPGYAHNDQVLYQYARALDELGRVDEAVEVMERLIAGHPHSRHLAEVQFRRAEYYFTRRRYLEAEGSYGAVLELGMGSEFYELALYKLGWTFYKQDLHPEALRQYLALLDYKVSTGYDFDQREDEDAERRIADTFRVISLSFSNLGGPDVVQAFFADHGPRIYEDRIYSHLGEFYLEKRRYEDAAASYRAFVALHPLHRSSPHFGMRVVEIYEAGGFPQLVLASKKEFAATYALDAEYWRHFDVAGSPEVLSYLRGNLEDLAGHYHALYQEEALAEERPAHFAEARRWYRAYLASFPEELSTPAVHYRLADLMLENRYFDQAAREYERTAYDYPPHERSAEAGYAAIYAHRKQEKRAEGPDRELATRLAVESTLRFVDAFPEHAQAAPVLGAAVDDLYAMGAHERAIAQARRLIEEHPDAELAIRRSAWTVVAHASFDLADYPRAEAAYQRVLEMTDPDDDSRQAVVDNLAASIYKQGEQARLAEDHRSASQHFLRVARSAPDSEIRALAEYDAGAELIRLEDWDGAVAVLEDFRAAHPDHELRQEATKQIAAVHRDRGDLGRAAAEYQRVAEGADDPEVRREALLVAGDLYQQAGDAGRALAVYTSYVEAFPEPLEPAVETRFEIAELRAARGDAAGRREQLRAIVELDAGAGTARTARIRYLAARSALVLSEDLYRRFAEVALVQPFERNLREKQARMDAALAAFEALVDYEVGEVTAAATFYVAEIYGDFSRALMGSERPAGLDPGALSEYETMLEEEAFPFEELAIEVHQKNLELMGAGVYNRWIERSLDRLAALVPGRYAKSETSSGFIASIDGYAYRAPGASRQGAAGAGGGEHDAASH